MSAQNTSETPQTEQLSTPSRKRSGTVGMAAAIGIAIVLLIVGIAGGYYLGSTLNKSSSTSTTKVQLTETGSSLLYPLMTRWAGNYSAATISAASTGSGTGLAMIYNGTITTWNNPWILAAQPSNVQTELGALSSETIHPIKRSDSSGDTFLFTSLCYMSWAGWSFGYSTSALTGDTVATGATGNSGVVSALGSTVNSIGYVGISYESSANAEANVHYAALGDNNSLSASGGITASNYILPSAGNISDDANLGLTHLEFSTYQLAVSLILGGSPAGAIDLLHGGGGTNPSSAYATPYPDANLEYTLIKTAPTGSVVTSTNLAATVQFLQWALSGGNWASGGNPSVWINSVNFIPLTPEVTGYDLQELAGVST